MPPMTHLPDNTLLQGGKYKILRFINSGGFGCTYEADHTLLEQHVAIKEFFVKDFCNRDETTAHITVGTESKKGLVEKLRKKFIDEARALYKMQHPGIVRVSDVFEENGTAYYVMDYIEGRSLSEIVHDEGPLAEARALNYIRQVSAALDYVHAHNRLHLDVKPGNIMIDASNHAVLIDFGASKQYDEENGENTSTLMGKTPGYAPSEQMCNDVMKFTPATDIYALGATLYKLLSGVTPINASMRASGEDLDPLPSSISSSVVKAVEAAMELNKKKRPQTISEWLTLLNGEAPAEPDESEKTILPKQNLDKEVARIVTSTPKVSPNDMKTHTPTEISYHPNSACGVLIIGFIMLLIGVIRVNEYSISRFGHRFDFTYLGDSDGVFLIWFYLLLCLAGCIFFIIRRKKIQPKKWIVYRVICSVLFVINTVLLSMWNHSVTMAFISLSVGLLLNAIILFFIKPKSAPNNMPA
jgi:serine/threonine protein kinase